MHARNAVLELARERAAMQRRKEKERKSKRERVREKERRKEAKRETIKERKIPETVVYELSFHQRFLSALHIGKHHEDALPQINILVAGRTL